MSNESSYTTDIYAFSPFYRVSYCHPLNRPPTTCQAVLFHAFGLILYVFLHMLSSVLIYISTQSFNFAITVGLLYLCVSIVRHSKQRDGIYIVDVETGTDPTIDAEETGHNGYDITPSSDTTGDSVSETESESDAKTENSQTSREGDTLSNPSTDPELREETPPESEESGNDSPLKEE